MNLVLGRESKRRKTPMEGKSEGESERESNGNSMSSTNWSVVSGSLSNCVIFESSDSSIDHDVPSTNPKTQTLLLQPYSADSSPCEIILSFTQKHEVLQIYVCSTARVYEIYFASHQSTENQYLCTVSCGVAVRDGKVFHTDGDHQLLSPYSEGSHDNLSKENVKCDKNNSNGEDDWVRVDVKVQESSVLGDEENSSQLKFCLPQEMITQDFYEATAEIANADPCSSFTIRLLSLQSKNRVYVDEIYVFADPVDSDNSKNQVGQVNSAGSSLMTMLLPALLQLPKTKGVTPQEKNIFESGERKNFEIIKTTNSSEAATEFQKESKSSTAGDQVSKLQDVDNSSAGAAQLHGSFPISFRERKADLPVNNRVESALDQLCSRMGRVEELFSRLEENLLKPINSIESRLQRVEKQLDLLTNKQMSSELPSCSRFVAPEFSCTGSEFSSFYQSGSHYPCYEEFESNKKDASSDAPFNPSDDTCDSVNTSQLLASLVVTAPEFPKHDDDEDTDAYEEFESNKKDAHSNAIFNRVDDTCDSVNTSQLLASLVVTAPEFSNCDDEKDTDASGLMDSSGVEQRGALTVDNALASALAGFMTSCMIEAQKNDHSFLVRAPEFSNGKDDEVNETALQQLPCEVGATNVTESISDSVSNALAVASLEGEDEENTFQSINYNHSEKETEGIIAQCEYFKQGKENKPWNRHPNDEDNIACCNVATTDLCRITEGCANKEGSTTTEARNLETPDQNDSQTGTTMENTCEGTNLSSVLGAAALEVTAKGSDRENLQTIFGISHSAPILDFEIPVLDVKFISHESCGTLADLLPESKESISEAAGFEGREDALPTNDKSDLVSIDDGEAMHLSNDTHLFVDLEYCRVQEPLSLEGETSSDYNMFSSYAESLI